MLFNVILSLFYIISHLLTSISIIFLLYIFYRSEIYHNGLLGVYYYKYYVLASCIFFISIVSYFIPKSLKINLSIIFLSFFIGLYIIEGYLNLESKKISIYKNRTGKDYDTRSRFDAYKDLKKINPNIVASPHPVYFTDSFETSPLSGIANRTTFHCNENGYYSIYKSDRYGFNNPDLEWDKDITEFLLVGDSMTRGACVNEPNTISGNIKKKINNKNGVLNLGQSGNGPLRAYATLKEYLHLKSNKKIIWVYYEGNDLKEFNIELKHKTLIKYLNNKNFSQNLASRNDSIQKLLLSELNNIEKIMHLNEIERKKLKRSQLMSFLILTKFRVIFFESLFHNSRAKKEIFPKKEFKKILQMANELINENNAELYFVYLPSFSRFQLFNNNDEFMHYKEVLNIVKKLKIPIIDINKELFVKHKDPMELFPFRSNGHYNVKGYKFIAKKIFDRIIELEKIN